VFPSLSDFFETVLVGFQEHSQALLTYIEQEEAKGFTHKGSPYGFGNGF
jgi:hypothetical protein